MLRFMVTRRYLRYADVLDYPRLHELERFSYRSRGFFIASTISPAFVC